MNDKSKSKILIVDDEPENIRILANLLKNKFITLAVTNGIDALEQAASENRPDIILLDIVMPDMDGYEVCQRLKSNKKTRDIPIIFITALDEVSDKVRGFSLGAIDYITKPFQAEEVMVRVKTHISMRNMQKKLEKQNKELKELVRLREDIESIARHDMANPLQAIIGYCSIMDENSSIRDFLRVFKIIRKAVLRLRHMINISLDLLKMEKGTYVFEPEKTDILKLIAEIIKENESIICSNELSVNINTKGKPVTQKDVFHVKGEELLCYSMLTNIIINGLEASPYGEQLVISLDNNDKCIIRINNKGTVPEEIQDNFFEKYVTSGKKKGTGLGTYSAKLIAETQGGTIDLETSKQSGTSVTIHLPAYSILSSAPDLNRDKIAKDSKLQPQDLAVLPESSIKILYNAASRSDYIQINFLIRRMRTEHAWLAHELDKIVRNTDLETIKYLTGYPGK
ncbi:hybrid sensor histidine kinase/response regulator [Desulfobacterales bacterium HSG17]|nr:hybrid sensor histidine kinase/response regulator [Desulfobacterales bacterium HSG17]